jgi:hypothetical protein
MPGVVISSVGPIDFAAELEPPQDRLNQCCGGCRTAAGTELAAIGSAGIDHSVRPFTSMIFPPKRT